MLKRFYLIILFSFIIFNFSYAFHQNGTSSIDREATEGLKKKDIQAEYCTQKVSTVTKNVPVTVEVLKDGKKTSEEIIEEIERNDLPVETVFDITPERIQSHGGKIFVFKSSPVQN